MKGINKSLILIIIFQFLFLDGFAFSQFEFGDSLGTVKTKYQGQCVFMEEYTDPEWLWLTVLECKNYKYKRVSTKLIFEFNTKMLVRVSIISKDIKNYSLIRQKNSLLTSKAGTAFQSKLEGYSKPLFKDKVHKYGSGKVLTYFYYKNNWEWDLIFENNKYRKQEPILQKNQIDKFQGKGLKGWANFQFDDSVTKVKENLEGLCAGLIVDNKKYLTGKKIMMCKNFPFANKKINLELVFKDLKFMEAILHLKSSDYKVLLPLLKKKYKKPFQEAVNTPDHYPFIYFTGNNILMTFQTEDLKMPGDQIILKYSKQGYFDDSRPIPVIQPKKKRKTPKASKPKVKNDKEVIFDSL